MPVGCWKTCSWKTWIAVGLALGLIGIGHSSNAIAQRKGDRAWVTAEPLPNWIWDADGASEGQQIFLQQTFSLDAKASSALLYSTCDNSMTLWINGTKVGSSRDWPYPIQQEVAEHLSLGKNTISVQAKNAGGIAAFVLKLVVKQAGKQPVTVLSDTSWKMSRDDPGKDWFAKEFNTANWAGRLKVIKPLGGEPWAVPGGKKNPASLTGVEDINLPDGFAIDLLYEVPNDQQGSWVALTTGPGNSLIASDQGEKGAFLIDVVESDNSPTVKITPIEVNEPQSGRRLSGAQGLLWAHDALWFHKNGGHLFRVTDSDGDGKLDHAEQLPGETGGGEHGNHAVISTQRGKGIYMAGGNHAPLAELAASRVTTWAEDLLLPRMWDAKGHARGKLAPGGWVTRLDLNTMQQELICIGFRNEYDIALNRHGDIFTFDADMEWDLGSPWYRPTRICQVVSGGDYGWRSGTGKWPTYYEDSLPPVVEIGPGSPTGVVAGTGAKFPAKYQEAIFALDWTFGTIYAIHLKPQGAGYVGTSEPFVTGSPLPVTDAIVGKYGDLYFTVGGRGAQSALYRVRYVGDENTDPVTTPLPEPARLARADREMLEGFHTRTLEREQAKQAIETAWPFLNSDDRFLRAAARVAIESQPIDLWDDRVLSETRAQALITAAVALARAGNESHQASLIDRLLSVDLQSLSESQMLGMLRAISLTCIRLGKPTATQQERMIAALDPLFPSSYDKVNTELVKLLVYLESPTVIDKTMKLIANPKPPEIPDWSELAGRNAGYGGTVKKVLENHPPSREIGYALALRTFRDGWTIDQRRQYFQFLNEAAKKSGGASYPGFLRNIRDEALGNCSDAERVALQDVTGEQYDPVPDFEIHPIRGPGRVWTVAEAKSKATRFKEADFENGRSLYFAANCGKCHRHGGLGGNIGPDLTSIPNKFDVDYVIQHIIDPSKVISDQYQASIVLTAGGSVHVGLVSEADGKLVIYTSDVKAEPITVNANQVESIKPSNVSQMPKGLIDGLSPDELRDLLAYLMSGGDPKNEKIYGKK